MKTTKKLPPIQQRIYNAFTAKNKDFRISAIYREVYGLAATRKAGDDQRAMQQKLAPNIALLNDKLQGGRIEPGKLKGTYRLNTKGE